MGLTVKTFPLGPLQENTYLIIDEFTGLKAIIDPGYYGYEILKNIGPDNSLRFVILTHGHFDHFYAAEKFLNNYTETVLIAPRNDEYLLNKDWSQDNLTSGYDISHCPKADCLVGENDTIELGETMLSFIETPGHTEGSLCILADRKLFSGDTLFRFSVGNTSFETGDWDDLVSSISNKIYTLDDDVIVYPGHGPYTTIGDEKRGNPFV